MSDLMLHGVLNMPLPDDPAECDIVTQVQFKARARQSSDRIKELEAKLDDKEAECRYLRGQVGLLTAKLERAVFLADADIARIDEICENPPPITQHMQAALDRILTQTGEKE